VTNTAIPGKRIVVDDGYTIELDLAGQVLKIDAVPYEIGSRSGAFAEEVPVRARIGDLDKCEFVSASVLAQKAKVFDDGLYAAVDIAAQNGAGCFRGKADLLRSVGRYLAEADPIVAGKAQAILLAAAQLGGVSIANVPENVINDFQATIEDFLADELRSKPMGFYAWSEELSRIFRQDRMLQTELKTHEAIKILVEFLRANEATHTVYESYLRLVSRLTNPLAGDDLRKFIHKMDQEVPIPSGCKAKFFPPSAAHETNIAKKLYGDRPIPPGFVLVDEMIRQIRSGELDLMPQPESGWYDHQTWALEPLILPEQMPEAAHLVLSSDYRKLLVDLFKGILALTRETHIKQLELPTVALAGGELREKTINIPPDLSAEPLPSFYLRRALSYRFVRNVIEECFGSGELTRMHRLTPDGQVKVSLSEELSAIESLFIGAHATVAYQLGMAPDGACGNGSVLQSACERFAAWAANPHKDADVGQDLRMMVPIFYDIRRRRTKIWAFLGWSQRPISIEFANPPKSRFLDSGGTPVLGPPRIRWAGLYAPLAYPVTAELYVDRILDRKEFRKLCNACKTQKEILRRLGGFPEVNPLKRKEKDLSSNL